MRKLNQYINTVGTTIFAILAFSAPFSANAFQYVELVQQRQIIKNLAGNTEEDDSEDQHSTEISQQIVIPAITSSFIAFHPVRCIDFAYSFSITLQNETLQSQAVIFPSLLGYIKNILLFFTAPHAP